MAKRKDEGQEIFRFPNSKASSSRLSKREKLNNNNESPDQKIMTHIQKRKLAMPYPLTQTQQRRKTKKKEEE
uniref:Uncharacterized protein n=1 Tax=Cucumis melo TaxID=3656 RepID=A0A9I9CZ25_CUCME